jgi:hypothetical protein
MRIEETGSPISAPHEHEILTEGSHCADLAASQRMAIGDAVPAARKGREREAMRRQKPPP